MHEAAIDPSQILLKARLKALNRQLQALADDRDLFILGHKMILNKNEQEVTI